MFIAAFSFDRPLAFAFTTVTLMLGAPAVAFGADHGGHGSAEPEEVVESSTGYRGIDLGDFSIRTYRPAPMRRDEVNFHLHAAVKSEEFPAFDAIYQRRKHKIREQVIVATRLVPVEAFDDPELNTLRRRILLRLRRTVPELKFDDLYVSDFHLVAKGS